MPVFKRDDPLLRENYRPIAVLPIADNFFEQIVAKRLAGIVLPSYPYHFIVNCCIVL